MPSAEKFYLPPAHPPARLEASIFLCDFMAPDMLYHLRSLELVFPPIEGKEPGYISADSPAHHDWTEAIAYARDKLNLPSLTIRIYFQDFRTYKEASRHRKGASLTRDEGMRTIIAVYELLVSPLSQLAGNKENKNGLGRCFVHAA